MDKHNGLPVSGYRPQTSESVERVNNNKRIEEETLRLLDWLGETQPVDKRWLAIGRTQIEQGWMAINRAIFKPSRASLQGDSLPDDPKA